MGIFIVAPMDRVVEFSEAIHKAVALPLRLLTAGMITTDDVSQWVGVEPPPGRGLVNLVAPEPKPGDQPGRWLTFDSDLGNVYANTSDLVAIPATDAALG